MWQFWIDVGGTFTDCLALSPDGTKHQIKVLSSGRSKGRIELPTTAGRLRIESGRGQHFWNGAILRLVDPRGQTFHQTKILSYHSATGEIEMAEWPRSQWITSVAAIQTANAFGYELDPQIPAPVLAIRQVLQLGLDHSIPDCAVHLGTTRGTNALLTRTGARTAFVTTKGFRDLLTIGDQARPHLFHLAIKKPAPLFETAIEVDERILADGRVERAPSPILVRDQLQNLRATGVQSLGICLMHGFQHPQHERLIGQIAQEIGFDEVRLSSEVAPLIKILARGETTVLDAYLNPVLGNYLDEIQGSLTPASRLQLMTSAGGLVRREHFSGKDAVLSGPAGGIVGAARVAQQAGFERVLTFDMGGTSSDVGRFDGEIELEFETKKSNIRIMTPMVAIETVAAGGGSVCWFDGTRLMVGPQSATSDPGPACYGRGGPLAVTDLNLFLGRIVKSRFPFPLDESAVETRLNEILVEMKAAGFELSPHELAAGFLAIANQNMASAIRSVSIARGYDPREYLLVAFGGAGPQHGCAVADAIGIEKILDHPQGSVLSAAGIRLADQTANAVISILRPLDRSGLELANRLWAKMESEVRAKLVDQHSPSAPIQITRSLDLRYAGTSACQTIAQMDDHLVDQVDDQTDAQFGAQAFENRFAESHQQLFGFTSQRPLEMVAARVEGRLVGSRLPPGETVKTFQVRRSGVQQPMMDRVQDSLVVHQADVFDRGELQAGDRVVGPAIIAGELSTTVVDAGWHATLMGEQQLLIEKINLAGESPSQKLEPDPISGMSVAVGSTRNAAQPDPVQLEIYNNHFSSIARQMGISLQLTSMSVNVKERLDFSCAIFTRSGDLVVNAPHIPVHLGAMSETVRAIIRLNETVRPGDVFVTNDPFAGGSHLPDVTVVTPVFEASDSKSESDRYPNAASKPERRLLFWVASRSHHAEIGGITPGSMPAHATNLAQEGVLIRNFKLIDGDTGQERFDELRAMLTAPPYPSRSPDENLADIRAQVAANRTGLRDLLALVADDRRRSPANHRSNDQDLSQAAETRSSPGSSSEEERAGDGDNRVLTYMRHIQTAAEHKVLSAISRLKDGEYSFTDQLDNGATIRLRVEIRGDALTLDFSGTDPVLPGNLNANPAIVASAVIYVMRCLIDEDIPLNEGVIRPVNIELPECFLNPASFDDPALCPAIVGGNVETSQRVVDVLLGALNLALENGLAAASQGTMNNWLIGDATFGYYETVGGGAGATSEHEGADAVHTHMTNTRLTDPEVLETRYPAILREFSVRLDSGGDGLQRGGHGMVREIEFLRTLTVSLLTNRRTIRPYGLNGGEPGSCGRNVLIRFDGDGTETATVEELPGVCEFEVQPGQRLRLETPGGGGWGPRTSE